MVKSANAELTADIGTAFITNFGQMVADRPGSTFRVDVYGLTNRGTLAAENGGLLEVRHMTGPTGGLRATGAGSRVLIQHENGAP